MKKAFQIIGLFTIICFSFFITEQTVTVVKEQDPIMIELESIKNKYYQAPINAIIKGNTIIPGISGKKIDIDKSYSNIKKVGYFDIKLLKYKKVKPSISLVHNQDKYIIQGNPIRNQVSLLFILDTNDKVEQLKYGRGDKAGDMQFSIKNLVTEEENEEFNKNYRAKINMMHDAAPDDEGSIWLWNRYLDNIQMTKGIGIIRTALWVIGLFTLLSGIVGVSNIMLITVKERTREFGIRKAIGAKPWQILRLIIIESIATTAIFGYIGMLCGVVANEYMDATLGHNVIDTGLFQATMFVDPTVGLDVCIQATLVIILAGTVAGLIPAVKAARVRPIEALRAE